MDSKQVAFDILKRKGLLIENDKTCECHTYLVINSMIEFASQVLKQATAVG